MEDDKFSVQMKKLKRSFKEGDRFVLFVGAGQNGGHNVHLMWNELIKEVSKISFRNLFQEMGVNYTDIHTIMQALDIEPTVDCQSLDNSVGVSDNTDSKRSSFDIKLVKYLNTYFPLEIQVSMIKDLMKDHYIPALQSHLYSECNYDVIKESFSKLYSNKKNPPTDFDHLSDYNRFYPGEEESKNKGYGKELYTLFTIARLILLNPQIESVITYNFDNFIRQAVRVLVSSPEKYFSKAEIDFLCKRFCWVGSEEDKLSDKIKVMDVHDNTVGISGNIPLNYFPVYHVHGYIPDPNEEEIVKTPDIVMALEEFVEQQTDGLSWQDAVQVEAFRNSNIIFIGCSMTDLTMKRMINFAHARGYNNKIYILNATYDSKRIHNKKDIDLARQKGILDQLRRKYFESLGATFISCPNGFNSLCDAFYEITYPNLNK